MILYQTYCSYLETKHLSAGNPNGIQLTVANLRKQLAYEDFIRDRTRATSLCERVHITDIITNPRS